MSEDKTIVGYDVTVRGQYYAASGKERILKTYGPVTFFLPEYVEIPNGKKRIEKIVDGHKVATYEPQFARRAVTVDNVALYVVQRRLLPTWLQDNHENAVTFRTCQITPGGIKRVLRPASDLVNLEKPVAEMSVHELKAFCGVKQLNVPVTAFSDVREAREAVQQELDMQSGASAGQSKTQTIVEEAAPKGVEVSHGAISSADGIAKDNEDPAADLL